MIPRHLLEAAFGEEAERQMRFVAGPRQIGKTTLARGHLERKGCLPCYFNWDLRSIRALYRENPLFFWEVCYGLHPRPSKYWVCFDEIHKMPQWKNILKGAFDEKERDVRFIVTGSARLDWFRKSGDSLAGRYFLYHLLPVTLAELLGRPLNRCASGKASGFIEARLASAGGGAESVEVLLEYGGFPEPLLKQSKRFHKKWQDAYTDQLVREDLRDLTHIRELENVAILSQLLPSRVGSPLSVNSLREDLEVSYNAVKNYLKALELAYIVFTLAPYRRQISRSIKKEKKMYFWDWTRVGEAGARFENFMAVQLQVTLSLWNDLGGGPYALHYVRTTDGRETDFLITLNNTPWLILEAKLSRTPVASHHIYHAAALGDIPLVQVVAEKNVAQKAGKNLWVISADRLLA